MPFHIVLYQPEIPPNTGNIIRLCANTGASLHLVQPLGFTLDDSRLRRAGLDYHEWARVQVHDSLEKALGVTGVDRVWAFSTRGSRQFNDAVFSLNDVLLFGPETSGLPAELLESLPADQVLRVPMREHSRSLNLANTVSVAAYEAWRQLGYPGGQ
ncbi:MAG: tRNA (uridine(34)/cytosine(34)/5-carboxymethylaminomethyluridine(34)-2'-O)-methyltransferase TrmL [Pseudomonadales bacterium]|nr:tRNA (uridine(34)/cytosine(34)/5-carboxymethylaminomethyluridine(34)-2'-O)-methyltransferase TrmL [Pseudomonadales bacterium]